MKRETLIDDREGYLLLTICHVSCLRLCEAFDLLLNLSSGHPDVASSKPIGVVKPVTFVVATTAIGKLDDLKADDVGV